MTTAITANGGHDALKAQFDSHFETETRADEYYQLTTDSFCAAR